LHVHNADIISFVSADNNTNTTAVANLFANGTKVGDCGSTVQIIGTLLSSDGSSFDINIPADQFFTETGFTVSQDIARGANNFTFSVNLDAAGAQSVVSHQAMTKSNGFVNKISDSAESHGMSDTPICAVSFEKLVFEGYTEESTWTTVEAVYTGSVSYELSCGGVSAFVQIMQEETQVIEDKQDLELVSTGPNTYNFTVTLTLPNVAASYYGKGKIISNANEVAKAVKTTGGVQWAPPCHLTINNFEKVNQFTALDYRHTTLGYNIQVTEVGGDACTTNHLKFELKDNSTTSFERWFSENDKEKAMGVGGLNYSIQVDTAGAGEAVMHFNAPNATHNQTS